MDATPSVSRVRGRSSTRAYAVCASRGIRCRRINGWLAVAGRRSFARRASKLYLRSTKPSARMPGEDTRTSRRDRRTFLRERIRGSRERHRPW
jgi:hypothetical protein